MNSEEPRRKMMKSQQEVEYLWKGDSTKQSEKSQFPDPVTTENPAGIPARSTLHIGDEKSEEKKSAPEKRYILIMSRFNSWCPLCQNHMTVESRSCPGCGVVFTHISTDYTCVWMADAAKNARPDLIFVPPGELTGIQLFA